MTRLGCLVVCPKLGRFQSPTKDFVAKSKFLLHSRSHSGSAHCIRSTGAKSRSRTMLNVPTSMLKSILACLALVNAESGEGTIGTSNQSCSVYIGQSLDDVAVFT